jgi:methionyl-tRNA formyltransferase
MNKNIKKIVYMGTPKYAQMILQTLIDADDMSVSLVLTQPDRAVGRKKVITPPLVKVLAEENSIRVLQPQKLRDNQEIYEAILDEKPDFIIVAAFGQILPQSILDIAPCINLHASLLPKYRGASPVQQALLNGDKYSGVTSMLMEAGLDSGDILGYSYFKIPTDMRLVGLMEQLSVDACELTLDTIRDFNDIKPLPQIKAISSHCKKILKSDGEIEFDSALDIYNKYRAFEGWPDIFTDNGLKILDMNILDESGEYLKGEILEINKKSIVIGCLKGKIEIKTLQPKSKKAMEAKAYVVGKGFKVGDLLV